MLANRRLSSHLPFFLILLLVIISFVYYFVGLSNFKAPPGSDYGNYLTQVEILRGNDLRGWGLRHNPIFFIILDIFLRIFEEFDALKIVASLVFSLLAIPFFLFARKLSGSRLAAVICTWLFVLFISNSEMISWGGTPNFLGFSFMLLTLFFFTDLMDEPSKKNLLLSGLFLSLVIGTHILVAIYLLFSFLIFFIATTLANRGINKIRVKNIFLMTLVTVVFCIPYFSFYINFLRNSSNEMAQNSLFQIQIPQISFGSIWGLVEYWEFFVVAIVFVLGIFALSKYVKEENKNNGLLLCSLSLSPLLLALVTEHLFRWLYFLPIPLILCFGIYLRDLFFDVVWLFDNIKENIIIHAYKSVKNSRKTIYLLVICFITIIGFYSTVMTFRYFYPNNRSVIAAPLSYQFIKNDEIEAFKWIKENTAPNATIATSGHPNGNIGGGGNSYGWWIEGYCKRVCVFSGDLNYFSYKLERDEIRIVNRIFSGTYSAEYENLSRVAESYPSYTSNPKIAAFIDNDYQDMFILNDAQHELFFSSNEKSLPFYSENRTSSLEYGDAWANLTFTYKHPDFELIRSIIMGEEKSSVDVVFQILPKNATLNLFKVNLWSLFDTSLEEVEPIGKYGFSLSPKPPNEDVKTQITLLETNGKVESAKVLFENPKGSKPVISYSFEPLQDSLYVRIRILIESPTEDTTQEFQFYDTYDSIKDLHIDYIFLNKYRVNDFQRFYESEHFTFLKEFGSIVIFKVN